VIYASPGLGGQPQFTYQDPHQSLQFSCGDIRKVDSDVGRLVSATIVQTTDTGSTTFSLLIPRVTLQDEQPAHIQTAAVTTAHRLTVPVNGHTASSTHTTYTTCREPRRSSNSGR
jgi:hypothetical protein